jgi:hypothetical protein
VKTLIDQIRAASEARLYYVALQSALTIPDIAGALTSTDRTATSKRYADWFDQWARPRLLQKRSRANDFTGKQCYIFRCSMLHQGASFRSNSDYKRIMFIEPGYANAEMHYVTLGAATTEPALLIQVDEFIDDLIVGCQDWLKKVSGTEPFEANYALFARRHADGLKPWLIGVPVIG